MDNGIHRQSSLKERLKNSICCFTGNVHHDSSFGQNEGFYNKLQIPRTPISPAGSSTTSLWGKKTSPTSGSECAGDHPTRFRGRSIKSRVGRRIHHHHRQSQSADFSYDPSSYALNFENESPEEDFPFRDFNSRLPSSPPSSPSPIKYSDDELSKEIVGYR